MTGIIYKYTSPSGKSYIGQTIDPERRMEQHKRMEGDYAFHRAIKKYGFENFTYEVLVTVDLDDEQELKKKLDFFEKFYIRKFHTFGENGYNMTLGGDGCLGFRLSEEARQKISKSNLKRVISSDTRRKMSEAAKGNNYCVGRVISDETRVKISESNKGKSAWNKGKTMSEETKRKISEAKKGKSAWNKGKTMSEETCKKLSEAMKRRLRDEKGHFIKSA